MIDSTTNTKKNPIITTNTKKEPVILDTHKNSKNGQEKCPKCGATEISLNPKTGKLRCLYCRYEFEPVKLNSHNNDIQELNEFVVSSGLKDIDKDFDSSVVLKCTSCGAEVVVDTESTTSARCHWCRNVLSINQQLPNGTVPDLVLPFNLKKEEAQEIIKKFVGERKFFAHPKFIKEFTVENIMGVYFPYNLVDLNCKASFKGIGEHETDRYTRGSGDNKKTYYDADVYDVKRIFDIIIKDLTIEASSERLDKSSNSKTNNIINSIMPFDTENCVKYNSNYLKGFTSERRDTNIDAVQKLVSLQAADIAKFAINDTLKFYDRGVAWDVKNIHIKGQKWMCAYLPVWLYSYKQDKGKDFLLHYVSINARSKEVMGSVPINYPKLWLYTILIEIVAILGFININEYDYSYLILITGILFFIYQSSRYRNKGARHFHEKETEKEVSNLQKEDKFLRKKNKQTSSKMLGANNEVVDSLIFDEFKDPKKFTSLINKKLYENKKK